MFFGKCRRLPKRFVHVSLNAHQTASMRLHTERGEGADRGRDKERESE